MDETTRLFMRHLTLAGIALVLVGSWMASLKVFASRRVTPAPFTFAWSQVLLGVVFALIGLVLGIIGLSSQPLVD